MQFSYFREWKYSMAIRKKKIRSILKAPDKCRVLLRSAWMEAQCFCLSSVTVLHVCLQNDVAALLKPISEKIQEIQTFRERNRGSTMFNHLSAVSESIPALGWIAVVSLAGMSPLRLGKFLECLGKLMATSSLLHPSSFSERKIPFRLNTAALSYPHLKFRALCSEMQEAFHWSLQNKICLQFSSWHLHCFSSSLRHFLSYPIFFFFLCLGDGPLLSVPQTWSLCQGDERRGHLLH